MNSRTVIIAAVALVLIGIVLGLAFLQRSGQRKIAERQKELERDLGNLTQPMTSSIRNFAPVYPAKPKPRIRQREGRGPGEMQGNRESSPVSLSPLTIFAADPQPPKSVSHGPKGDYAPAFRLIKCQLVNTVDSSNTATPIIGLVTEDLWWNGKLIIRANSEVHGVANVDRVRERIASNGEFTFVLNEPSGVGRELVIRGIALDMEKDDAMDSYGITDGSAGAFSSGANGFLGNRVYTNNSSLGLSALQGGVVNPAVGGTQNVLDRFSDQIASSVERDGFFVRVPAGKQFYVYCTEAIDLTKAVVAADEERTSRADADLTRQQREIVRRALPVNSAELINPLLPAFDSILNNKK
jgi:hypothetical protein